MSARDCYQMNVPVKIIGVSHRTADISTRVAFESRVCDFLEFINSIRNFPLEHLTVSTCNRTEIVFSSPEIEELFNQIDLSQFFNLEAGVYVENGLEAVKHFYRVCSGVDSLVLGEAEILGQVKNAYRESIQNNSLGPVLHKMLQEAFRVAKKIRSNTGLGKGSLSVASLAVMQAMRIFGTLDDRKALIIGAGSTGALVSRILSQKNIKELYIANRTYEKAQEVAKDLNAIAVPLEKSEELIGAVDIVVVAINPRSQTPIVNNEILRKQISTNDFTPRCFLDLSVPRMVDAKVDSFEFIYSFCMDDFNPLIDENLLLRQKEAVRASFIVSNEVSDFANWHGLRHEASLISRVGDGLLGDRDLFERMKLSEAEFRILVKRALHFLYQSLRIGGRSGTTPETNREIIVQEEILEFLRVNSK